MAEEAKKEEAPKKSGKGGMLFAIIAAVVGIALGGGAVFLLGGGSKAKAETTESAEKGKKGEKGEKKKGEKKAEKKAEGGGHGGEGGEGGGPPPTNVVPFDPFLVNLADQGGQRYLKVTLRVVTTDPETGTEIKNDELTKARIRDRVISALTSKMYQDISTPAGKEQLRQELVKEMNGVLPEDSVEEVLFVEFAVQ